MYKYNVIFVNITVIFCIFRNQNRKRNICTYQYDINIVILRYQYIYVFTYAIAQKYYYPPNHVYEIHFIIYYNYP